MASGHKSVARWELPAAPSPALDTVDHGTHLGRDLVPAELVQSGRGFGQDGDRLLALPGDRQDLAENGEALERVSVEDLLKA